MNAGAAIFLLMSVVQAPVAGAAESAAAQPKLVVAEPLKDFGRASRNSNLSSDFTLRNDGDAVLHLASAVSDCPCLTVRFDPEIAAHGEGHVHIELATGNASGPLVATVMLTTDDPAAAKARLTAQALVIPQTDIQPETIRLIAVQHEPAVRGGVTIWAKDREDFAITAVESTTPAIKAEFHEAVGVERIDRGTGRQWRVEATAASDAPVGVIGGQIRVLTNHPNESVLVVPASGFMRPLIAVTPPEAGLGSIEPATYRKKLDLAYFGKQPITLTKAESSFAGMRLEIKPVVPGKRFEIWVTFDPKAPKGDVEGTIRIATDYPGLAPVAVPFSGSIK